MDGGDGANGPSNEFDPDMSEAFHRAGGGAGDPCEGPVLLYRIARYFITTAVDDFRVRRRAAAAAAPHASRTSRPAAATAPSFDEGRVTRSSRLGSGLMTDQPSVAANMPATTGADRLGVQGLRRRRRLHLPSLLQRFSSTASADQQQSSAPNTRPIPMRNLSHAAPRQSSVASRPLRQRSWSTGNMHRHKGGHQQHHQHGEKETGDSGMHTLWREKKKQQ